MSICLRHRMSSRELCDLNGLRNPRARVGDVLLVWAERSEEEYNEEQRKMLVRQFRRQTGCNAAEATYYLDSHSFQIGDAIREWRHDVQFERERALCVRSIREEDARLAAEASREAKRREAEEEATAAAAAAVLEQHARLAAATNARQAVAALAGEHTGRCLACLV